MIGSKTVFGLLSVVIYIILLNFIVIEIKNNFLKLCPYLTRCISFCSEDRNATSDSDLIKSLLGSEFIDDFSESDKEGLNVDDDYKTFRRQPECIDREIDNSSIKSYQYSTVCLRRMNCLIIFLQFIAIRTNIIKRKSTCLLQCG